MVPETLEGEALQKFRDFDRRMSWRLGIETTISIVALCIIVSVPHIPSAVELVGSFLIAILLVFRGGVMDRKVQEFHRSLEEPAP